MGGSHETPFKMKGSGHYGLGNSSPAKDKAYRNPGKPENKAHNAKAATEQHHGYPHGPKPTETPAPKFKSPAKGRETWVTEDDRETTRIHNKKHADGTWDADHKTLQQQDKESYEKESSKAAKAAGEDIEDVKKKALET